MCQHFRNCHEIANAGSRNVPSLEDGSGSAILPDCQQGWQELDRLQESNQGRLPESFTGGVNRLLETIPAVLWVADPETLDFTWVSGAVEPMFGYRACEWLEHGFWFDHIHEEDRRVIDECRAMVRARRDHELVYRLVSADGNLIWVRDQVHVVVVNGNVVELCGAVFDITAERDAHDALVQSELTYRLLVQSSPDAIGVHIDGRYIYVNPRFVEIVGAESADQVLGREVLSFVHPDYADVVRARHAILADGHGVPMIQEKFIRLDGKVVDVEVMAIPITFRGAKAVQVVVRDITERLQAAERLELLSAGTSEAIWEGDFLTDDFWSNDAYKEMLGDFPTFSRAQEAWRKSLHPEDRIHVESRINRCTSSGVANWSDEYRLRKRDGTWVWVLARRRVICDSDGRPVRVVGALVDITPLREAEQRYLQIFDQVQDVIYTLDVEGRITGLNPAFEIRTGYRISDWIGRSIADILLPESVPRAFEDLNRTLQGASTAPSEYRMQTASGTLLEIEASGRPRIVDGVVVGSVGIIRDVTERNVLHRRLESEKRISSLGALAASISHEFNNVLMSIQPFVEILLRASSTSPEAGAASRHIGEAIARGKRITNEILLYANPKDPQIEPMNVSSWLESFLGSLRGTFPSTIHLDLRVAANTWIHADQYQVGQIIMNLATNARDAMPGGGSLLIEVDDQPDLKALRSRAALDPDFEYVRITVRDTGCGISDDGLSCLWEPLYTTKRGGTGLGLPIAKRLIDRQNGAIVVESRVGEGTAFHLFFRKAGPAERKLVQVPESVRRKPLRRILLVEDDPAVGEGIAAVLSLEGVECLQIDNGEAVLDAITEFRPDVVVLDVNLPGMSGIEVCSILRDAFPEQPVILSTGHFAATDDAPHTRALLKPYSTDELIEACHLAMNE